MYDPSLLYSCAIKEQCRIIVYHLDLLVCTASLPEDCTPGRICRNTVTKLNCQKQKHKTFSLKNYLSRKDVTNNKHIHHMIMSRNDMKLSNFAHFTSAIHLSNFPFLSTKICPTASHQSPLSTTFIVAFDTIDGKYMAIIHLQWTSGRSVRACNNIWSVRQIMSDIHGLQKRFFLLSLLEQAKAILDVVAAKC